MNRRSLRASGAIVAAAACVLALVTVPAAGALEVPPPSISIVPSDGAVLPPGTTAVSATITPAEGASYLPTGYYYGLVVLDFGDGSSSPYVVKEQWSQLVTTDLSSLILSAGVAVEEGHQYGIAGALAMTPTIEDPNPILIGAPSYFVGASPVDASFTYPMVSDPSGDYWCGAGWSDIPAEVTFDGTLLPGKTYAIIWYGPDGPTHVASYTNGPYPDPDGRDVSGYFDCGTEVGDYALKAVAGDAVEGATVLAELPVHVVVQPDIADPMPPPSPNPFAPHGKAVMSQTLRILTAGHLILRIRTTSPDFPDWQVVYERDYGIVKAGKKVDLTWNGVLTGAKKPAYGDWYWCVVLTNDHNVADGENWPISIVPYKS
ncbi:MAG TPA: hypothetical protein VFI47_18350 [Acidimicrobiales bacterium]|nr:hypothetical protein [Acidimicrobiales bacterium]